MFTENIISKLKKIGDFLLRNLVWVAFILAGLFFLQPGVAEFKTLFFIIAAEGIALFMSGLANFAYTKFDFINLKFRADSKTEPVKISCYERAAGITASAWIFIGVHLLVAVCVFGYYWTVFAPVPTPNGL